MDDVTALEGRITRALDRIRTGVDAISTPAGTETAPDADPGELQAQLEEERTANAQLEERVRALKERQDTRIAELDATVTAQRQRYAELGEEIERLRQANAELRDINGQLRAAMAEEVAEPHLVNKAMLAEIDALRAVRASEAAEVGAVLAELKPLVGEDE